MIIESITKNKRKTSSKVEANGNSYDIEDLIIVKYKLYEGLEIEPKEFYNIVDASQVEAGYNASIKYLAKFVKSEVEVRRYLINKKIKKKNIDVIIKRLNDNKILNDDKTINFFINSLIIAGNGVNLIRYKLKQKGFSDDLINENLETIDLELYNDALNKNYLKALKKYEKYDDYVKKNKIWQYLYQKGYTKDEIEAIF